MSQSPEVRIEHDSMGEVAVPAAALYGAQTQRAVENFPISGSRLPRSMIWALGLVKAAAAAANGEPSVLDGATAAAMVSSSISARFSLTAASDVSKDIRRTMRASGGH